MLVQATLLVTEDEASILNTLLEYADDNVSDLTYIRQAFEEGQL